MGKGRDGKGSNGKESTGKGKERGEKKKQISEVGGQWGLEDGR